MNVRLSGGVLAAALLLTACGIRPRPALPDAQAGTTITAKEIAESEAATMWEALQRTVRHAQFAESAAGAPVRVHRRGFSSISLREDMPIYIDKVQVRDLTILDAMPAHDIELIQVLTGVHATTYYGTNAGDGVILIRTRAGNQLARTSAQTAFLRWRPARSGQGSGPYPLAPD